MLATLVKFSQASDSYPPHQQKFVKKERSIYTAYSALQSSVNLLAC